jgi:hypothetical protein
MLAVVLGPAAPTAAAAAQAPPAIRRVLIVSIPRLTWPEVAAHQIPNLERLASHGAVGDLSLRTIGPRTSMAKAYLSLGAGNRAAVDDIDGGQAYAPSDPLELSTAAVAYRRRTGIDGRRAAVLQMAVSTIDYSTEHASYGARPGALADSLAADGWTSAVVGNADAGLAGPPSPSAAGGTASGSSATVAPTATATATGGSQGFVENRPAALAMMNHDGQVPRGQVGPSLLRLDPNAPYGVRMNITRTVSTLRQVWSSKSVALVELSDLDRADRFGSAAAPAQRTAITDQALKLADAALGKLLAQVDLNHDLVYVLSPAAPRSGETLTPLVIAGPGFTSGTLRSGTTRRTGYVALTDVAPSILDRLGITKPSTMTGAPISAVSDGGTRPDRWARFIRWNQATVFSTSVAGSVNLWFEGAQLIAFALIGLAVVLRRTVPKWLGSVVLFVLAVPVLTFASAYVGYDRLGSTLYQVLLAVSAAVLATGAHLLGRALAKGDQRRAALVPPLLLVALTWLTLIVDVLLGGAAQINTVFGYSPIVAGRFDGFGNTAFGFLAMAAVVLVTGGWALFGGGDANPRRRRVLLAGGAAIFLITVVTDGAPSLGSDVGGVLAMLPAAGLVLLLLAGHRVRLRTVLVIGLLTIAALGAFAAIDLARPAAQQTHLARLVHSTFGGAPTATPTPRNTSALSSGPSTSGAGTTLRRKLDANLGSITGSTFSTFFLGCLAFMVLMGWRARGVVSDLAAKVPGLGTLLWGALAVAVLGDLANDSGISVPAVMFPIFLGYLAYLTINLPGVLGAGPPPRPESEPEPDAHVA